MRFFIGLLIGIGAALAAAFIWDRYASDDSTSAPAPVNGALTQRADEPGGVTSGDAPSLRSSGLEKTGPTTVPTDPDPDPAMAKASKAAADTTFMPTRPTGPASTQKDSMQDPGTAPSSAAERNRSTAATDEMAGMAGTHASPAIRDAVPSPTADRADQPPTPTSALTASAWTAFHSRASARGFARHLHAKTGIAFDIIKKSPGRYDVVFEYLTDDERRDIESRIASAAGTGNAPADREDENETSS